MPNTNLIARIAERFLIDFYTLDKMSNTHSIDAVMSYAVDHLKNMTAHDKLAWYIENGHSVTLTGNITEDLYRKLPVYIFEGSTLGELLYKSRYYRSAVLVVTDHEAEYIPCDKQVIYFSKKAIPFTKHLIC